MKKVIESNIKQVEFNQLRDSDVSEVIFESPDNWVLTFDKVKFDYVLDYCQSTGRSEIVDTCVKVISSGEIALNFTDDGKENKKLIDGYSSEFPDYDRVALVYRKFIKKS